MKNFLLEGVWYVSVLEKSAVNRLVEEEPYERATGPWDSTMNAGKNILDASSLAKWSIDIFDSLNEGLLIADVEGIVQYVNKQ